MFFVPLVIACDPSPKRGLWRVQYGDIALDAANVLGGGIERLQDMAQLNPGVNLDSVENGDYLTVSYVEPILQPAVWETYSCTPTLYLNYLTTEQTPVPTTETLTVTSQERYSEALMTENGTTRTVIGPTWTTSRTDQTTTRTEEDQHTTKAIVNTMSTVQIRNTNISTVATTSELVSVVKNPNQENIPDLKCSGRGFGAATIKESLYKKYVNYFCEKYDDVDLYDGADSISLLFETPTAHTAFLFFVSWIGGCSRVATQRVGKTCKARLMNIFEECADIRKGGWRRDGCLEFSSAAHGVLNIDYSNPYQLSP